MQILNNTQDLSRFMDSVDLKACLADTSFLYGLAYEDDLFFESANDVHDYLAENKIDLYTNVVGRMEFIDLIFRKQMTLASITLFNLIFLEIKGSELFNILKKIRDDETAAKRNNQSHKISERQLKKLRKKIDNPDSLDGWHNFCQEYIGDLLSNDWAIIEDELGLKFIEIMENQTSPLFEKPLAWSDMVSLMGRLGLRGPDAMILNLFNKSKIPLLITGDRDFEFSVPDELKGNTEKAIYIL